MLGKLISLIAQAKGATAVGVLVVGAATATVATTNPEVQNALTDLATSVGLTTSGPGAHADCDDKGQPEVVAQRNAADKLLRVAWQDAHKALTDLRGGKDVDNKAVGDVVKKYDDQLKATLDAALDKTASLTLGRVGQNKPTGASGSSGGSGASGASGSTGASGTSGGSGASGGSGEATCPPGSLGVGNDSGTSGSSGTSGASGPSGASGASGDTGASGSTGKPDQQGRVTVAERTTLDAAIQAVVDEATAKMTKLVEDAKAEVAALPPAQHGKPSDNPGSQNQQNQQGGKPSDNPGKKP